MKKTLEDYGKALKSKYEEIKNDEISGLLLNPSPANLKTLSVVKAEGNLSVDDNKSFELFFNLKDAETLNKISSFDIDKLRPVGNFLKGKTTTTSKPILELIAVLIDYDLRPYGRFIRSAGCTESHEAKLSEEIDIHTDSDVKALVTNSNKKIKIKKDKKPEKGPAIILISDNVKAQQNGLYQKAEKKDTKNGKKRFSKAFLYLGVSIVFFLCLGYFVKKEFFSKDCLQWNTDHYVAVSCKGAKIQSLYEARIIEWNAELIDFRKLSISEKTKFFINGKPAVWYSKDNNIVEFFNAPGVHPLSGKSLKPVTQHIVLTHGIVK